MATAAERAAKLQASIEAQQQKLAELKRTKARLEARQRFKETAEARKNENGRKVLLGAFLLAKGVDPAAFAFKGESFEQWLTQPHHRARFGFANAVPVSVDP